MIHHLTNKSCDTDPQRLIHSHFRTQESRIYVSSGIQCILPVFVIVLVGCEFLRCVFRALYFLEFGSAHKLWLKFHRPSTIMMKWRPVILTPLVGVTLVTHVNSCLESDVTFGLPWILAWDGDHCVRAAQNIFGSSSVSLFYPYFSSNVSVLLIKHAPKPARSLELAIWSGLISGSWNLVGSGGSAWKRE